MKIFGEIKMNWENGLKKASVNDGRVYSWLVDAERILEKCKKELAKNPDGYNHDGTKWSDIAETIDWLAEQLDELQNKLWR